MENEDEADYAKNEMRRRINGCDQLRHGLKKFLYHNSLGGRSSSARVKVIPGPSSTIAHTSELRGFLYQGGHPVPVIPGYNFRIAGHCSTQDPLGLISCLNTSCFPVEVRHASSTASAPGISLQPDLRSVEGSWNFRRSPTTPTISALALTAAILRE
jgi:hypothetical protein